METIENIEKRKHMSFTNWCYSVQRIDLLIITVSGAGEYVILETLKYSFNSPKPMGDLYLLKISGVLFVVAILLNIYSQVSGKWANHHDIKMCTEKLSAQPRTREVQGKIKLHDQKAEYLSNLTDWMNTASLVTMSLGLIALIIYFLITI
jgi:hypothetical protein